MGARIKAWERGSSYPNRLIQISMKIGEHKIIFNGYLSVENEKEIIDSFTDLNISYSVENILRDVPRKAAVQTLNDWCDKHNVVPTNKVPMFITTVKLALNELKD